jgi:hypothetical protein
MDMRMFFLLKSLSDIVCHTFQVMKNIDESNQLIQNIKSMKKRRPLGINQFKWFNLKGQIQNKIK